jgi:hypothetical protein
MKATQMPDDVRITEWTKALDSSHSESESAGAGKAVAVAGDKEWECRSLRRGDRLR